jgi:hypothetical protein
MMGGASRNVLLVGSVPLEDTEAVFKAVGSILGGQVHSVPDGETGPRLQWINWQSRTFEQHPMFGRSPEPTGDWRTDNENWKSSGWFALRENVNASEVSFGTLGYASVGLESYNLFVRCKENGVLAPDCRFQVSLPTPYNVIDQLVVPNDRVGVEPVFERQMMREVQELTSSIPHHALSLQWDVAHEVQNLAGGRQHWFGEPERQIVDRLTRLAESIPSGVELGIHLCYGDFAHKHFIEPIDMNLMVRLSNALCRSISRRIDWIHMPVPRGRTDAEYYAPLADLRTKPETRIYLGLIHYSDGLEGARTRLATASRFLRSFGVATECGFGRRAAETVIPLLHLHAQVADLAA